MYCDKCVSKFWVHLIKHHADKPNVREVILENEETEKKRKIAVLNTQSKARFYYLTTEEYTYCQFCNVLVKRYWYHVERAHKHDSEKVAEIINETVLSVKRAKVKALKTAMLQEIGIVHKNKRCLGESKLCPHCKCYISKKNLWKHIGECQVKKSCPETKYEKNCPISFRNSNNDTNT
uniref:Uncharacterized protein n=1 Tax=Cacopsylla melanoneura TaxID=428564 RepID=A0A8D9B4A5_9HEMI